MTAYWINTFTAIRDADKLAAYVALSGPAILAAGGEPIVTLRDVERIGID